MSSRQNTSEDGGVDRIQPLQLIPHNSYPRIDGVFGGFLILMLWVSLASMILLIGAETDRAVVH